MDSTAEELKEMASEVKEIPCMVKEELTKDMETHIEATRKELMKGFVEVVKQGIKEEVDKECTLARRKGRKILRYDEKEEPPYTKVWRAGEDPTRPRVLIHHQFSHENTRIAFLKTRVMLRDLKDKKIYLDDDLTPM